VAQLEALLPGLQIDVEAMKASEWVRSTHSSSWGAWGWQQTSKQADEHTVMVQSTVAAAQGDWAFCYR
jgi:hypothetical protein